MRLPSVLAKAAASLDVLSGGRVELGVGGGAFWEWIEAMGGRRLTPKQSVDAFEEALAMIRGFWSGERSVTVEGEHYRVTGAKPGPAPVPHRRLGGRLRPPHASAHRPRRWPDKLARTVTELRFSMILVSLPNDDPVGFARRLGEDVAPRLRALVAV